MSILAIDNLLIVAFVTVARLTVSLNSYSGAGKPPLHGDFEAQRHWMEITVNLPVSEWYVNSTENDLNYWGLDYPPLTAYHSFICGWISNLFNSSWVELGASRGIETSEHKLFMRYTVLVADILIYFPAVFSYFWYAEKNLRAKDKTWAAAAVLIYPGLILIDHGHFQYNCVSLGLALWAIMFLSTGHDILGSIAFVLALNYKQMELYHAMPFFCYLLGSSFRGTKENWFWKLTKIGLAVVITFALCWLPFLSRRELTLNVLGRLFPFARGLFEDKVANVWCSISVVIKLKQMFDIQTILRICLFTTLTALIPSSLHLLLRPSITHFRYALVNSSLVFFLFSFQVHEKSILIPALAVCTLLPAHPFVCTWFLLVSSFSMLPLLIKDGLLIPFLGMSILFYLFNSLVYMSDSDTHTQSVTKPGRAKKYSSPERTQRICQNPPLYLRVLFWLSMSGAVLLTVASVTIQPPANLPDLFPLLVSVYSCVHFVFFLISFHWLQFSSSDTSGNVLQETTKHKSPTATVKKQL